MMHIRRRRRDVALVIALFVTVAFGALSVHFGQDANWDLKSYHLYNPFQLLNGRLRLDFNAVGFQNLFNPLLDLPYYFISVSLLPHHPRVVAFIMGLNNALLAL